LPENSGSPGNSDGAGNSGSAGRGGVPGLLVTGRYRLAESIGQGGMGRVWRAADETLDRQVAVKEMRIDGLDAEDTRTRRERTLREARATARIDHPNVVRVYDVVDEGERLWIVMELVNGRSLEWIMAEEGALSPRAAARIGLGLVAALRQVHAGGVLHRDIKPGNVLVENAAGRVVLTDFGIAAIQDAKALTMVGMLVGSPDYMAPERISGRPQGPPSDVWSLGATLCAALGGRSPFSRDTTLATLHAVLYEEPELPDAAGPLRELLAALLEKDPTVRPDLAEVEQALRPVAYPTQTPTETHPAPAPAERPTPAYVDLTRLRPAPEDERPQPPPTEVSVSRSVSASTEAASERSETPSSNSAGPVLQRPERGAGLHLSAARPATTNPQRHPAAKPPDAQPSSPYWESRPSRPPSPSSSPPHQAAATAIRRPAPRRPPRPPLHPRPQSRAPPAPAPSRPAPTRRPADSRGSPRRAGGGT
jgi:serine/threonine protein kinase